MEYSYLPQSSKWEQQKLTPLGGYVKIKKICIKKYALYKYYTNNILKNKKERSTNEIKLNNNSN